MVNSELERCVMMNHYAGAQPEILNGGALIQYIRLRYSDTGYASNRKWRDMRLNF